MVVSIEMNEGTVSLLRELRDRDNETGLLTASRLYQALLGEIARSGRYGNPLSCVLLQVRGLNADDTTARRELASRVAAVMRNTDHAGRWENDDFLLVLPETDEEGAHRFAAKVKQQLTDSESRFGDVEGTSLDVRIRVAAWNAGDDAEAMLKRLETKSRV